jgi:hypothetical protein
MARGYWTTNFSQRAAAQYQADQIARAMGKEPNVGRDPRDKWVFGFVGFSLLFFLLVLLIVL